MNVLGCKDIPITPSGVGGGLSTRWLYSEYGTILSAFHIVTGMTYTFNLSSKDDIELKLKSLYHKRDLGYISNDDVSELEERLRTANSLTSYGRDISNAALSESSIVSEGAEAEIYDDLYKYAQEWKYTSHWTHNNVYKNKILRLYKAYGEDRVKKVLQKVNKDFKRKEKVKSEPYSPDMLSEECKATTSQKQIDHLREIQHLTHTEEANAKRRKTISAKQDAKILGIDEKKNGKSVR